MRHKITALGGLSPAAAAAVMSKPAEVNPSQQQQSAAAAAARQQQQEDEDQCSTLDIELLKEFELIGADSKNDNEEIKMERAVEGEREDAAAAAAAAAAEDLLEPEPRARCNTWPRLQYGAVNSAVNGGSPVMQVG